jgi:retron-type reverse transcriptase
MIQRLQEARGTTAKRAPTDRFSLRYDTVHRADLLAQAYALAQQRDGAPGVDGETFEAIKAAERAHWLAAVQEALRTETSRPQPVRWVMISKPAGGERPLEIPTSRDRVVQTAVLLILQPIFEADMEPTSLWLSSGAHVKRTARVVGLVRRFHSAMYPGIVGGGQPTALTRWFRQRFSRGQSHPGR